VGIDSDGTAKARSPADAQSFAARREDVHSFRARQQNIHEIARGSQHVLAVVEHDEEPALGDELQQRVAGRALRIQDPESRSDRLVDPRGVADGREIHPADTIAKAVSLLLRHS
jgi:hypothetical protein